MARSRHPNKEIEAALQYAESKGWRVVQTKRGHRWGAIYCPRRARGACHASVYSTPGNPRKHATWLRSVVNSCRCFDSTDPE